MSSIRRRPVIPSQRNGDSTDGAVLPLTPQCQRTSVESDVFGRRMNKRNRLLMTSSEHELNSAWSESETLASHDLTSLSYISSFPTFTSVERLLTEDSQVYTLTEDRANLDDYTEARDDDFCQGEVRISSHGDNEVVDRRTAVGAEVRRVLRINASWLNVGILADLQRSVLALRGCMKASSVRFRKQKPTKARSLTQYDNLNENSKMSSHDDTSEEEESTVDYPVTQIRRSSSLPYLVEGKVKNILKKE